MASSTLKTSIKQLLPKITDRSLNAEVKRIEMNLSRSATALDKNHVMAMFKATHDGKSVRGKEITQLELLYKNIKMTSSANTFMKDIIRTLRAADGPWVFDQKAEIKREELLWAKLQSGKMKNFGIRGTLYLNGNRQCETLERPFAGDERCVANGSYTMRLRSKYSSLETDGIRKTSKNYTRIQVPDNQTERSGIQIHWGQDISWSEGCTLVGKYNDGIWQGKESEATYKALIKKIGGNKAYQPANEAEWLAVPRVKLVVSFTGTPAYSG